MEPYTQAELDATRADANEPRRPEMVMDHRGRRVPSLWNQQINGARDAAARWLATLDALQARLAAAEAVVAVRDARIAELAMVLAKCRDELTWQAAQRRRQIAGLAAARPSTFDAVVFNDAEIRRAREMVLCIDTTLRGNASAKEDARG